MLETAAVLGNDVQSKELYYSVCIWLAVLMRVVPQITGTIMPTCGLCLSLANPSFLAAKRIGPGAVVMHS